MQYAVERPLRAGNTVRRERDLTLPDLHVEVLLRSQHDGVAQRQRSFRGRVGRLCSGGGRRREAQQRRNCDSKPRVLPTDDHFVTLVREKTLSAKHTTQKDPRIATCGQITSRPTPFSITARI